MKVAKQKRLEMSSPFIQWLTKREIMGKTIVELLVSCFLAFFFCSCISQSGKNDHKDIKVCTVVVQSETLYLEKAPDPREFSSYTRPENCRLQMLSHVEKRKILSLLAQAKPDNDRITHPLDIKYWLTGAVFEDNVPITFTSEGVLNLMRLPETESQHLSDAINLVLNRFSEDPIVETSFDPICFVSEGAYVGIFLNEPFKKRYFDQSKIYPPPIKIDLTEDEVGVFQKIKKRISYAPPLYGFEPGALTFKLYDGNDCFFASNHGELIIGHLPPKEAIMFAHILFKSVNEIGKRKNNLTN